MRASRMGIAVALFAGLVLVQSWSGAAPGDLTLVSASDTGVKGNGLSQGGGISSDGTKIVFQSRATNLDTADTDPTYDVYLKDLTTGNVRLVSTSSDGTKADGFNFGGSLSADGSKVAFESDANNLDPADTDFSSDVYIKDLVSGVTSLASTSTTGVNSNGANNLAPGLSADGTKVAFTSDATNLSPGDTDASFDSYVKDLTTGTITLASTTSAGVKGNGSNAGAVFSADGTKVAFSSTSTNLDPADTDPIFDVYVKDLVSGALTLASVNGGDAKGNDTSVLGSISSNGSKVAFRSDATNLDPGDTDQLVDVYVKDLVTGTMTLGSTDTAGVKGNGHSFSPSLSGDGSKLFFWTSSSDLDPADTDSNSDVYVKDLSSGTLTLISTTASGVKANDGNTIGGVTADGSRAVLNSYATNLDPADTDGLSDVYLKELGTSGSLLVHVTVRRPARAAGTIYAVTILSEAGFDATTVDPGTVCFGDAEAPEQRSCTPLGSALSQDVERDGDKDMVLRFLAAQTGIDQGDTQACLTAKTIEGTQIQGCGPIRAH